VNEEGFKPIPGLIQLSLTKILNPVDDILDLVAHEVHLGEPVHFILNFHVPLI
jgi:hypothetical protein